MFNDTVQEILVEAHPSNSSDKKQPVIECKPLYGCISPHRSELLFRLMPDYRKKLEQATLCVFLAGLGSSWFNCR